MYRCASCPPPRKRHPAVQCQGRPAAIGGRRPGFVTQLNHWPTAWTDPTFQASVFSSRKSQSRMSSSLCSLPVLPTMLWLKDSASGESQNCSWKGLKSSKYVSLPRPPHSPHWFHKWGNWGPERLRSWGRGVQQVPPQGPVGKWECFLYTLINDLDVWWFRHHSHFSKYCTVLLGIRIPLQPKKISAVFWEHCVNQIDGLLHVAN